MNQRLDKAITQLAIIHTVEDVMTFIKLLAPGIARVIRGEEGMIFEVDKFTDGVNGTIAHIRDYRFDGERGYAIWSLPADGYEIFFEDKD